MAIFLQAVSSFFIYYATLRLVSTTEFFAKVTIDITKGDKLHADQAYKVLLQSVKNYWNGPSLISYHQPTNSWCLLNILFKTFAGI